jgi:LytS/YehU family sensor histidine kinase
MKHTITFTLGFAFLGAMIGICISFVLYLSAPNDTYKFANWVNERVMSPLMGLLLFTTTCGFFLGALTGFTSAFSRGRFATVRCLLTITFPSLLSMSFFPMRKEGSMWEPYIAGAITATLIAVLLAYLGQRRIRKETLLSTTPIPPARLDSSSTP